MKPQVKVQPSQGTVGNVLTIPNTFGYGIGTYLQADELAGSTTLNVDNTANFPSGGLLLIGTLGAENAEIVEFTATPTAQTITTVALTQAHNRGESVTVVFWDTLQIQSAPAAAGPWTTVATEGLQVTSTNTTIQHTAGTTATYYQVRWEDTVGALSSGYSEVVSAQPYSARSVGALLDSVLLETGTATDDTQITNEFLLNSIDEARRLMDNLCNGIHWEWRQQFNVPIKMLAGTNFVELPDDIDFSETDRSVLAVRYAQDAIISPVTLGYLSKRDWNDASYPKIGSLTAGATLSGATSLVLENTGDFGNSGTVMIATDAYTQTILQVQYTGNNKTTNTLTGVTGITRNIPDGTQVWAFPFFAYPTFFTIFDGRIWFDRVIPDQLQAFNVYLDYYKALEPVTSMAEILPEHHAHVYKYYIKYAIKKRKDSSVGLDDPDYTLFKDQASIVRDSIYSGQDLLIITS